MKKRNVTSEKIYEITKLTVLKNEEKILGSEVLYFVDLYFSKNFPEGNNIDSEKNLTE